MSQTPDDRTVVATCSRCGEGLSADDLFCGACGMLVNRCSSCGHGLVAGDRQCPQCGQGVDPTRITGVISPTSAPASAVDDAGWAEILSRVQGATVGELRFIARLGRGGMAAVYLAEDIRARRKVAVKLILPELMSDERMVRRFQDEAETLANLRHGNIVRVFTVAEAAGVYYFTMDYIEGRSLETILEKTGATPIPVVRSLLGQVGSALGSAHRKGVFHRDVKPANILIDTEGNAWVTDFGIAKVSKNAGRGATLTQVGSVVGTPAYMSPEQCLGRPVTGASDQYSLGVVAYELIAGHLPFDGENSFALMRSHTDEPVPPLRQRRPSCPEDLEAAVLRMLSKKPDDRFKSMSEAIAALGATVLSEDDPMRVAFAVLAEPAAFAEDASIKTPAGGGSARSGATPELRATVSMIGITPPPESAEVGERLNLSASARDERGAAIAGAQVAWQSSNAAVATVDAVTGEVAILASGTVEFTASAGRARATVLLTAVEPRASAIEIAPVTTVVHVGETHQCAALVKHQSGRTLTGRAVSWRCSPAAVATITAAGVLHAIGAGDAEIVAECDGVSAAVRVPVQAAPVASVQLSAPPATVCEGDSFSLTAVAVDAQGRPVAGRFARWQSLTPAVAVVSAAGAVTALASGEARLSCTIDGVTESTSFAVTPPPVSAVQLTAPPKTVAVGDSFRLVATALDAHGAHLAGRAIVWKSSDATRATVDAVGLVTAVAIGRATISATSESVTAAVSVSIAAAPVVTVAVTGLPPSLEVGKHAQVTATLSDARGNVVKREVKWTSSDPAVATVGADGSVAAAGKGKARIAAVVDGVEGFVELAVTPKKIVVTPRPVDDAAGKAGKRAKTDPAGAEATPAAKPGSKGDTYLSLPSLEETEAPAKPAEQDTVRFDAPPAEVTAAKEREAAREADALREQEERARVQETERKQSEARRLEEARAQDDARKKKESDEKQAKDAAGRQTPPTEPDRHKVVPPSEPTVRPKLPKPAVVLVGVAVVGISVFLMQRNGTTPDPTPVASVDTAVTAPASAVNAAAPAPVTAKRAPEPAPKNVIAADVTVKIASISMSGVPSQVIAGDAFRVTATPLAQGGSRVSRAVNLKYSSTDPGVATVDEASGSVTTVAAGKVTIKVESEGKTGAVSFAVAPKAATADVTPRLFLMTPPPIHVGETVTLNASVSNATARDMRWISSNNAIALVDAGSGKVSGVSPGTATVTVRANNLEQSIKLEVLPVEVASIVAAASHALKESESARLTATPMSRAGQPLRDRPVTWESDRPQIVSVTADGVITGRAGGSAVITAKAGEQRARITVEVEGKAAPAPAPMTPSAPPAARQDAAPSADPDESARREAQRQLQARPDEVLKLLQARDAGLAAATFSTETSDEKRRLDGLREKMVDKGFKASELQVGSPQMGESTGTLEFRVRVVFITFVGTPKPVVVTFRAKTVKAGNAWKLGPVSILTDIK